MFYATKTRSWLSTADPGGRKESFSITAIICRFWSENLVPWITPCPSRVWTCQSALTLLRRRLLAEGHKEGEGTREFIRVLRLLEDYPIGRVRKAVEKALLIRAHSRDAVLQFLVPRFSWEHTTFLLDGREHLRLVKVAKPDLSLYRHSAFRRRGLMTEKDKSTLLFGVLSKETEAAHHAPRIRGVGDRVPERSI